MTSKLMIYVIITFRCCLQYEVFLMEGKEEGREAEETQDGRDRKGKTKGKIHMRRDDRGETEEERLRKRD
jgi:hypothetical protein